MVLPACRARVPNLQEGAAASGEEYEAFSKREEQEHDASGLEDIHKAAAVVAWKEDTWEEKEEERVEQATLAKKDLPVAASTTDAVFAEESGGYSGCPRDLHGCCH